jgi:hypothetical protein
MQGRMRARALTFCPQVQAYTSVQALSFNAGGWRRPPPPLRTPSAQVNVTNSMGCWCCHGAPTLSPLNPQPLLALPTSPTDRLRPAALAGHPSTRGVLSQHGSAIPFSRPLPHSPPHTGACVMAARHRRAAAPLRPSHHRPTYRLPVLHCPSRRRPSRPPLPLEPARPLAPMTPGARRAGARRRVALWCRALPTY